MIVLGVFWPVLTAEKNQLGSLVAGNVQLMPIIARGRTVFGDMSPAATCKAAKKYLRCRRERGMAVLLMGATRIGVFP